MKRLAISLGLLVAACGAGGGGGNNSRPSDMTATAPDMMCKPDPTFKSDCGKPCDVGNSLGVGHFCQNQSDCLDTPVNTFCTQLGDPNNFFCTRSCKMGDPPSQCGENTRCACQGGQCGCFPTACDTGPPPGHDRAARRRLTFAIYRGPQSPLSQ
jgi:hypothetical protein